MIITRAPFRIPLGGGGTDLPSYYKKFGGKLISVAIDKYIVTTVNRPVTDSLIRLKYSKSETVKVISQIKHPLIRETLNLTGIKNGIEISFIADIPAGTGMGSSGTFLVSMLKGVHAFRKNEVKIKDIAEQACEIEINILGHPIGKQDQYAVAFGGLNFISFNSDENVDVEKIIMKKETKLALQNNLIAFHTGINTRSDVTLTEQKNKTKDNLEVLNNMVELSKKLKIALETDNLMEFGNILHENWVLKQKLASNISNPLINSYYERAIKAGSIGGKILGSGGGGFLLFYCEKDMQETLRKALFDLREFDFDFEMEGSKIIYVDEE